MQRKTRKSLWPLNRRKNSEKDYANPKLLKFELCKETWKKDKKTTESNEPHKP